MGKQIGQGAYAVVRLAYHKKLAKKVALKVYDKEKLIALKHQRSVQREIRIMEKVENPYIVKFYEVLETPTQIIIVMEYIRGTSLHSFLKSRQGRRLPEQEAKRLFKEIVSGVSYCHSLSVSHRDIKLENILLDETNTIKIIDFGFSTCVASGKRTKVFCGTPSYMAPEIVARREHEGPPADVWALGILLYAMLCGSFPFRTDEEQTVYQKITRGHVNFPEHLSRASRRLMSWMLQTDPCRRPNADQILLDVWLNSEDSDLHSRPSERLLKLSQSKGNLKECNAGCENRVKIKCQHTEQKKLKCEVRRKEKSVDGSIVESIAQLGYSLSEIRTQLKNRNSHITLLYAKIEEHRKTQRKAALGTRRHSHNIARSKSKPGLGKRTLFPTSRVSQV
eukprot:TRINITY_DN1250_c0_g1_i2.p1 TRINITY_DN1250_c0_g1~~TRINITY_DN1250_c0_g1_i2.p1  ORF type:complete len:393 (+),score=124.82 TRINITY_DN1250_c0_g1_i2:771-1949(+)